MMQTSLCPCRSQTCSQEGIDEYVSVDIRPSEVFSATNEKLHVPEEDPELLDQEGF